MHVLQHVVEHDLQCNQTVLKLTYFMAVMDGVLCLLMDTRVIYKRETLSVVALESSEIMGT